MHTEKKNTIYFLYWKFDATCGHKKCIFWQFLKVSIVLFCFSASQKPWNTFKLNMYLIFFIINGSTNYILTRSKFIYVFILNITQISAASHIYITCTSFKIYSKKQTLFSFSLRYLLDSIHTNFIPFFHYLLARKNVMIHML